MGAPPSGSGHSVSDPSPVPGLGHTASVPSAASREAMREQKAIRIFLLVRAARALIRARGTSWWNPWDRLRAGWVAATCAEAAHALERGEHYAEQAEWLSPLELAQGMSAEGENSRSEVEGEARQPGPEGMRPTPSSDTPEKG